MNELFTEVKNGSLDILDIICGHLSSYRDLLALEQVSDLTCTAVRAHQHPHKVTLRWQESEIIKKENHDVEESEDMDTEDDAICRSRDGDEQESGGHEAVTPRGPIIQWLCVTIKLEQRVMASLAFDWLFKTLTQHAAHLKQLEIGFESFPKSLQIPQFDGINGQDFVVLNAFAKTALSTLTFPLFSWLTINFNHVRSPLFCGAKNLLPTFLKHFQALETLNLMGGCLPLLKHLAAPEKLKKLALEPTSEALDARLPEDKTVVINLSGLQTISILYSYRECVAYFERIRMKDNNHLNDWTGINLVESLVTHSAAIQEVKLNLLTSWSVTLLSSPAVAGSLRSLHLTDHSIENDKNDDDLIKDLTQRLTAGTFRNLIKLTIDQKTSEWQVCQFLALTPNIEELTVRLYHYDDDEDEDQDDDDEYEVYDHELKCEVQHPLCSLRRVTVNKDVRPAWLESLRSKVSPAGLEVIFA